MKVCELFEAIIKTKKGPIIRAQNNSQLETNVLSSRWRELRAIILPNQLWFVQSGDMIHWEMANELSDRGLLKGAASDDEIFIPGKPAEGVGVFIRDQHGRDVGNEIYTGNHPKAVPSEVQGTLEISPSDYGFWNYDELKSYPILKRFNFDIKPKDFRSYKKIKD